MKALWGQVSGMLLARLIQLKSFDLSKSSPFIYLVDLSDKVFYTLWAFLTPEETSLASWLLILQRVQPISEKKHINHLGHDMITFAKKTFLAVLELVALRVVLTQEIWSSSLLKWVPPPSIPPKNTSWSKNLGEEKIQRLLHYIRMGDWEKVTPSPRTPC